MMSIDGFEVGFWMFVLVEVSITVPIQHDLQSTGLTLKIIFIFIYSKVIQTSRLAVLPPAFTKDGAYATEYVLAWAVLPSDEEDKLEAYKTFAQDVLNKALQLNVEFM